MVQGNLRLDRVCLDNPDGGFIVPPTPAYVETEFLWNGFIIPFFTRENADAVMSAWNANATDEEGKMWFDEQRDGYCVSFDEREELEAYEGEDVEIDGQTIHVYGLGAMAWVWELEPVDDKRESYGWFRKEGVK